MRGHRADAKLANYFFPDFSVGAGILEIRLVQRERRAGGDPRFLVVAGDAVAVQHLLIAAGEAVAALLPRALLPGLAQRPWPAFAGLLPAADTARAISASAAADKRGSASSLRSLQPAAGGESAGRPPQARRGGRRRRRRQSHQFTKQLRHILSELFRRAPPRPRAPPRRGGAPPRPPRRARAALAGCLPSATSSAVRPSLLVWSNFDFGVGERPNHVEIAGLGRLVQQRGAIGRLRIGIRASLEQHREGVCGLPASRLAIRHRAASGGIPALRSSAARGRRSWSPWLRFGRHWDCPPALDRLPPALVRRHRLARGGGGNNGSLSRSVLWATKTFSASASEVTAARKNGELSNRSLFGIDVGVELAGERSCTGSAPLSSRSLIRSSAVSLFG